MAKPTDKNLLARTSQRLIAEFRRCGRDGFDSQWSPIYDAEVLTITHNASAEFNVAAIRFPNNRWTQAPYDVLWGDQIRIRTNQAYRGNNTPYTNQARSVVFQGFVSSYRPSFSGGSEKGGGFEHNDVLCLDTRWLLNSTSPVHGQVARGLDDYTDFGSSEQAPIADRWTFMTGRRCIFNENGQPNRDPVDLTTTISGVTYTLPIFCPTRHTFADGSQSQYWTARQMITLVLSPFYNRIPHVVPIPDPAGFSGLEHEDWDNVLNHIVVEGLGSIDSVDQIAKHLGWAFREQYSEDGTTLVFYKPTAAAATTRSDSQPTILHDLHAPAVGENIADAVTEGRKMCCDFEGIEDIAAVVNNPLGLGAPLRFEFTAELVPAWLDSDLTPDTDNLFFTEDQLLTDTNPDQYSFYNYYHARGAAFKRDVGRKWALNESGKYTNTYDRGPVFDFSTVLDAVDVQSKDGRRLFGPFNRTLLPCLTFDSQSLNSVGILVEFSFDGGATWYALGNTVAIDNLPGEAGIRIVEPNLANITIPGEPAIDGGELDGEPLNYWTSLAADKLDGNSFKNGNWKTRLRITASVQLDQRLYYKSTPTAATGSPFDHMSIYDFSDKYTKQKRADSSQFSTSGLPSWNTDEKDKLIKHLDQIRTANEDMSFSGRFTLDRLWLGDGSGELDIQIGDGIRALTGREYLLHASLAQGSVYPEIVQITYDHQHQKMHLLTRDLRLSEY